MLNVSFSVPTTTLLHGEERHNCSKVPTFQKLSALSMDRGNRFVRLNIRVYGQNMPVTHSHGFLVDDFPTGLSPPIGDIQVDVRKVNFESLRTTIEYNTGSHMNRRSLIFQEALFIMSRLPNLYDRPKGELTKWQYGYVKKNETKVKLIHPDREDQLVVSVIPELFKHDIVIVPLSQIPPTLEPKEDHKDSTKDKENTAEDTSENKADSAKEES